MLLVKNLEGSDDTPFEGTFSHEFYISVSVHHKSIIYRVSQEKRTKLREGVSYVKL